MNKQTLINSPIYQVLCKCINFWSLKIDVKGVGHCNLIIGNSSFLLKSKIKILGQGNSIHISNKCHLKSFNIEVYDNNNIVEIDDGVICYENGFISIKGNNCHCIIGKNNTIGSAKFFLEESET